MMLKLLPFDPQTASPGDWARLQAYRRLRHAEDYPDEPALPDAEFERDLRTYRPLFESRRILAVRGSELVGNLILLFRREGSPDWEDFAPYLTVLGGVPRAHRRQGVGTALLGQAHAFMQSRGKTLASVRVQVPDGHAFMAAAGAAKNFSSLENRLGFDGLDWDELARWKAHASQRVAGLTWEVHAGRVPVERLATLLAPMTVLINQQPLGSLDAPRIRYELEDYANWYADLDRRGGEHFMVLLRHGDEVAAVCDANWDARFADRVHQQLTAVASPWRGRGLAKGVKAAMLELIRARHPQVRTMITHNAQANEAMLSINQRLGFAVHCEAATYQIGIAQLARFTARAALPCQS